MKSFRKELWIEAPTRRAFFDPTPRVESCLRESGIREGLCRVNAMHITDGAQPGLLRHGKPTWLNA